MGCPSPSRGCPYPFDNRFEARRLWTRVVSTGTGVDAPMTRRLPADCSAHRRPTRRNDADEIPRASGCPPIVIPTKEESRRRPEIPSMDDGQRMRGLSNPETAPFLLLL